MIGARVKGVDEMRQDLSVTLEELLEQEDKWYEREDESNLQWIDEGIRLYGRLSQKNPREVRFKEMRAYLLLKQGEDLKLRQHSYEKAIQVFNQLVRIDVSNSIAHYRLGFLYFYEKSWGLSIHSFQQALLQKARRSESRLTKEQEIKAYHYILKATQILTTETLDRVEHISAADLKLFEEITVLLKEMKSGLGEREKPYQMIVNGQDYSYLTDQEYEELSDPESHYDTMIFNQRSLNDTTLSWRGREARIRANQVSLIEYLMKNPEGVSRTNIIERSFSHSQDAHAAENTLSQNIRRLRRRLQEELQAPLEFIETIEVGYRWNVDVEYRMFKHTRDVSTDLLPD
jgi:DNA-binding response OmpR family regulator